MQDTYSVKNNINKLSSVKKPICNLSRLPRTWRAKQIARDILAKTHFTSVEMNNSVHDVKADGDDVDESSRFREK